MKTTADKLQQYFEKQIPNSINRIVILHENNNYVTFTKNGNRYEAILEKGRILKGYVKPMSTINY